MPRRKRRSVVDAPTPTQTGLASHPDRGLVHQPRWPEGTPWKAGEIPRKDGFSLIPVIQTLATPVGGGRLCVEKPVARGDGKPSDKDMV